MAAAAEKRLQQEENRGMKDPEGYKRKLEQQKKVRILQRHYGIGMGSLQH